MEELQVPTRRITVKVFVDTGESYSGSLFVAGSHFPTSRPEEVLGVLNDERVFLPFQADLPSTEFSLLNKTHVLRVRVEWDPLAEGQPDGMPYEEPGLLEDTTPRRVFLKDGTRLVGDIYVDTPARMSRLVDKLNHAEQFLQVVTEDSIEFVQTRHVVYVG